MPDRLPDYTGDEPCVRAGPDVMFPRDRSAATTARAREICTPCPTLAACRAYGLAHEELGTWGGLTQWEREEITRRARARYRLDNVAVSPADRGGR